MGGSPEKEKKLLLSRAKARNAECVRKTPDRLSPGKPEARQDVSLHSVRTPPPPSRQCWFTSARTSVGTQQKQATPALAWAVLGGQFPPCR